MSKIITYRGKLDIGTQDRLHLSTNDGLTGYRLKKFQIISSVPGVGNSEHVGQIFLTDQTGSVGYAVDFNDADLLAVSYVKEGNLPTEGYGNTVIMDKEIFNQDIFVNITDAAGGSTACNYYIELEQFKIDLNTSTYYTLKNIRSKTQV
tara:strand:+ start:376 stop:822 length:447 start_codon:yes stop_codon:yes gene_type:complete